MPLYETGCHLCNQKTMHNAVDEEGANAKHRALNSHKEAEKQWDALMKKNEAKRAEFDHGKDHND